MNSMDVDTRLRTLVAELLGVSPDQISDTSSPLTLPAWDSMNHLKLILAVEEEFGVMFTTQEASEIVDLVGMRRLLCQKLGA